MNNYETIIGLEIHVELNTKTKMFCGCPADYFGAQPNTHTCPICLGLGGALPYTNRKAIESCVAIGLALNCKINLSSFFERKNYFYPDQAKGFQTSQFLHPFGENGYLDIQLNGQTKRIGITRVHMEEDTGKNIHTTINGEKASLIDFNRSGVPLVEIVTEPDVRSAEEAKIFLTELQKIVRYVGVTDADMEKGHMRLEPNISLRKLGEKGLPNYKVEVKNINSFRFAEKAIKYEEKRHLPLLEKGESPVQETRGWNETKNKTISQRSKEDAHDYRYFPEPDIPPIELTSTQVEKIKSQIPELPDAKEKRFVKEYGIKQYDAQILTRDKALADYFEEAGIVGKKHDISFTKIAGFIINKKLDINEVLPATLVKQIVQASTTVAVDKTRLEEIIRDVIEKNSNAVGEYKAGKTQVIGFLIGQTMKQLKGADVNQVRTTLIEMLK